MPNLPSTRRGLTLVEVLVVLLTVMVVVGLLLPCIMHARESARRSQCQSHLKQIGLALLNYHDAHNTLPPGFVAEHGWGWGTIVLPYIDSSPLYSQLNVDGPMELHGPANAVRRDLVRTESGVAVCPSDSPASTTEHEKTSVETNSPGNRTAIALSNYVGVVGDGDAACPDGEGNGTMWHNSSVTLRSIIDGTANTFLAGERDSAVRLGSNWAGTSYDALDPSRCKDRHFVVDYCDETRPLNGPNPHSFGSRHRGGAFFLMADGAVRFVSQEIDGRTYRNLANRRDTAETQ
jgi:type II secretory pathway pseudopilin PulG